MALPNNPAALLKGKKPDKAALLPPDKSLKHKLSGHNLDELIPKERHQAANKAVFTNRASFNQRAIARCQIELSYLHTIPSQQPLDAEIHSRMSNVFFDLKSESGTFGYSLASAIAHAMLNYLNQTDIPPSSPLPTPAIIIPHLTAIELIITRNMQGNGGQKGKELLAILATIRRTDTP